jgi:signal transduction histidine kinase
MTVLPLVLLGIGAAYYLVEKERESMQRGVRDRVHALMTAIDAEMEAAIAALQLLAASPSLQKGDIAAFRIEAERAVAARKESWENVVLTDAQSLEMLINLLLPAGAKLPKTQDVESITEAVQSRRGAVGNVAIGGVLRRPIFPVRVAVFRDGEPAYAVAAVLDVRTIARIVERQRVPERWALAVLDGNYRFVVRTPAPPQGLEHASDSLRAAIERNTPGLEPGRLLDGTEIYRAVQRSSISRWSVSVAVPRSTVDEGLRGLWFLIAAFGAAIILGLWIAWRLAARISEPIAALAAAAPAVGRGEASALPPPGPVEELRLLSGALAEAATAIGMRDRAKDEFLAMLGHELRNPLASVSNAAQILKLGRERPEVLEHVSQILERQVGHMARLVDDLLEVGRLTGGKVRLERAPLDLAEVAGELVQTWRSGSRFMQHEIHTELVSVWVSADRARIEQVISNLLDNALKYTPARGAIRLSVRSRDRVAVLEVSDTGEGLTPQLKERMFDLFVQGERDLARQPGGLGIGLTMAKRLVELHEGKIRAASEGPGKGTTITVELPEIEPQVLAGVRPARVQARARRILIVEDNADARESLAVLLRLAGQEVYEAANGMEALRVASTVSPDMALIDIGLPDLDGYELARRLKAEAATRGVRLVALTGYGGPEDRRRALAAGFDEHIAKPVAAAALERLIA